MDVTGKILKISEAQTFGASGFRKRELVVMTNEQYPQPLLIEFVQDKCDLLNNFNVNDTVKVDINLRGREWINPKGEAVYFNTTQGWRITEAKDEQQPKKDAPTFAQVHDAKVFKIDDKEDDDLPF